MTLGDADQHNYKNMNLNAPVIRITMEPHHDVEQTWICSRFVGAQFKPCFDWLVKNGIPLNDDDHVISFPINQVVYPLVI